MFMAQFDTAQVTAGHRGANVLNELENIARNDTSEGRRELLSSIADLFLQGAENYSDRELTLFADVMMRVLEETETDGRREFSERVAPSEQTPHSVAQRLAHDTAVVAAPVLRQSPVLSDEDLIAVAFQRSQDHILAISERRTLEPPVSAAVIERGDQRALRSISANNGARISDDSFLSLAKKCVGDRVAQINIAQRADLTMALIEKIEPLLPEHLSEQARAIAEGRNPELAEKVVQSAAEVFATERLSALRAKADAIALYNNVKAGSAKVDDVLSSLANDDRFLDLATVLARLSSVRENVITNILFRASNEPIAIICRYVDASESAFDSVNRMRARRLKLPSSHVEHATREFKRLSREAAERSIRFLRVRSRVED